jgi:hypothetical protein
MLCSFSLLLAAVICSGDTAYLALLSVHSSTASSAVVCAPDVDVTARDSHVTIAVLRFSCVHLLPPLTRLLAAAAAAAGAA